MREPFPVHFAYLGPDGSEDWDTEFTAMCWVAPRVGELVQAQAGGDKLVHRVYHRVVTGEFVDDAPENILVTTVVLRDRTGRAEG